MTAQFHESLMLEGKQTAMASTPGLPTDHPRVIRLTGDEIEAMEAEIIRQGYLPRFGNTACWRNYIANWEIKEQKLYLNSIDGYYRLEEGPPLHATWYSGTLRIPQGELLEYVHMGYGSLCVRDLMIEVEHGEVVSSQVVINSLPEKAPSRWERLMFWKR